MCIIVSEQCYYEIGLFYYAYDFVGIAGRNNFNSWYYKVSYYDKVIMIYYIILKIRYIFELFWNVQKNPTHCYQNLP